MIKKFAAAAAAILITASSVGECAAFATKPSDSYEDPDYVAPYEGETEDGFVYYKTGEEIMIVDYKGEGGDIVIPEYIDGYPVTDIILIDFSNSNARSITFPGTIKEIDSYLITGISTLEEVTIGEGTECIGSMFCTGCENLRKVTLPDSLKEIGDSFLSHTAVESLEIPDQITELPSNFCNMCPELKTVKLPANLTSLGNSAFAGSGVTEIELPDTLTNIEPNVFSVCRSLSRINIPEAIKDIPDGFCMECHSLRSIELPKDLNSIGRSAFCGSGLRYLEIPDTIKSLPDGFCAECSALERVKLPSELEYLGAYAFSESGLVSIEIPGSVKVLETSTCNGCESLEKVTLHEGTQKIDSYCFEYCYALSECNIPEGMKSIGSGTFRETALKTVDLPASLTDLSQEAFTDADRLEKISIPEENEKYFSSDGVLYDKSTNQIYLFPCGKKGTFIMPEIDYTGMNFKFDQRINISELVVADSFNWDSMLFYSRDNMPKISLKDTNKNFIIEDGAVYSADKKKLVLLLDDTEGEHTVEEGIECIGTYAFFQCNKLTSVICPKSLKRIDDRAFETIPYLCNIEFNGDSVELGDNVFGSNTLRTLELPANFECDGSLPESLEKVSFNGGGKIVIGPGAFEDCRMLEEVVFPEDSKEIYIKEKAFANTNIEKVFLPSCVKKVGKSAFENCSKLTSVVIDTDAEIDESAFRINNSLEKVVFKRVGKLESKVFSNCKKIKEIECPLDAEINGMAFNGCNALKYINGIDVLNEDGTEFVPELDSFIRKNFYNAANIAFLDDWLCNNIQKIVSELIDDDMSDIEKAAVLHDWVCDHAVYDFDNRDDPKNHTDASIMLNGIAVCDGYAKTYNLLLHAAGLETCFVVGDDHSWNVVNIDGKYFHIDTTWDDEEGSYNWFMLTDQQMKNAGGPHASWIVQCPSVLHAFQTSKLPECSTRMGDLNRDGVFGAMDMSMLRNSIAENSEYNVVGDLDHNGKLTAADIAAGLEKLSYKMGDANEDGDVGLADSLAILQHIANEKKYRLGEKGKANADVFDNGDGITAMDALVLQKRDAGLVRTLPTSFMIGGKQFTVDGV